MDNYEVFAFLSYSDLNSFQTVSPNVRIKEKDELLTKEIKSILTYDFINNYPQVQFIQIINRPLCYPREICSISSVWGQGGGGGGIYILDNWLNLQLQ